MENTLKNYIYNMLEEMELTEEKDIKNFARSLEEKIQKELARATEKATQQYLENVEKC